MQLEDWLDDLCVRFIVNLPPEELESVERICFQVEEAQWFYEDFIRPLDPTLPSLPLRAFSLRIFQHCPLFSQWSAQHYTTAFAEFLAYKNRVPVRGAIMLNETMDEVVLVKGWKKSASWSFPRGKINKDENDLDCAVREVYEETGFDIQAAGLVKEEKEMKFIEVTMREQHMRLYVFRGVPKDTYFEPRTRKEISKIEWYKLTDLPTLKKHKHQDSNGDATGLNANRFYMVAPFLNPLKKWIVQQRKNDSRRSLHAPQLAVPSAVEETATEDENVYEPRLPRVNSHGPSDLPEVTVTRMQTDVLDPSAHLKQMLKIKDVQPQAQKVTPKALPNADVAKSSALLALLRGDSTPELRAGPSTPMEQIAFPPEAPRSPHREHPCPPPFSSMQPPPPFPVSPADYQHQHEPFRQHDFSFAPQQSHRNPQSNITIAPPPGLPPAAFPAVKTEHQTGPPPAPYQKTGDPSSFHGRFGEPQGPAVPPASALPKLTNHTRSLLDVFKSGPSPQITSPDAMPPQRVQGPAAPYPVQTSPFPSLFTQSAQGAWPPDAGREGPRNTAPGPRNVAGSASVVHRPTAGHQASLLDLFRSPSISTAPMKENPSMNVSQTRAVELAANPAEASVMPAQPSNPLLNLLQEKSATTKSPSGKRRAEKAPAEGEASATINGPLNLPQFEGIKGSRRSSVELKRSPIPANRTLFDPNQPTPIKILARPEDSRGLPARSPRQPKAAPAAPSPKKGSSRKEPPKPFQPQILRRPQTAETQTGSGPVTPVTPVAVSMEKSLFNASENAAYRQPSEVGATPQSAAQKQAPEAHKQTLLSLFNRPPQQPQTPTRTTISPPNAVVSPLTASQMISPLENEPISTRSRVGSIASIASGSIRPSVEKRQTAAGDKAFLLGYLSRIASQES